MDIEITRVNYYEGQYLGPTDFTDEQAYHVAMRRRHHLAHHTWGIVRGLTLSVDPIDQEVSVAPGFAIDGYGRELVLPQKFVIPPSDFDLYGNAVAVFLEYDLVATDSSPQGTCDPAALATARQNASASAVARQQLLVAADSLISDKSTLGLLGALEKVQALIEQVRARVLDPGTESDTRWRETLRVMRRPASGDFDPKAPPGVPAGDLNFPPTLTPPDDPAHEWPVYLGTVTRDPATLTYQADLTGLPYAGLRGEAVIAPSLDAWVRIGGETTDDPNKFEVYTLAQKSASSPTRIAALDPFALTSLPTALRLAVDGDGRVDLRGEATLSGGNLTVVDGGIEFIAGDARPADTVFDLKLIPGLSAVGDIPTVAKNLVLVAEVVSTLHFRMFSAAGRMVLNTDETQLTANAASIADFKKLFGQRKSPHVLTPQEKDEMITSILSLVGYTPSVKRPLRPWQIYRQKIKAAPGTSASNGTTATTGGTTGASSSPAPASGSTLAATGGASATPAPTSGTTAAFDYDVLFLEIPIQDAITDKATSQFVIGSSKDKKFYPALTVSQDGTVTVHGNLVVGGTMTVVGQNATVPGAPTPGLQSLSAGLAAGAVSNSVLGAGTQTPAGDVDALNRLLATNPSLVAKSLTASAGGRDAAATELTKGPEGTDAVVNALLGSDMGFLVDSLIKATGALNKFSTSLLGNIASGSTKRMDEFAANLAANAGIAPFVDSLITKLKFDDLAAAFTLTDTASQKRMDTLLDAILKSSASGSLVDSLKRSTARLDLLVGALSDHTAVDAFVASVLAKPPATKLLAKGLADDSRMGTLVDAFAAITPRSGLDNLAAALASTPTTPPAPPNRMDAFVGTLKTPNRMGSMVQSLLDTSAIDFLVDAFITKAKMDKLATSLNASNSAGPRMGPFIDGVIAADGFKAFAASLIGINPTSSATPHPRIDDLVDALVGTDGLDHLAAALASTPTTHPATPNRMDAFAGSLSKDTSLAGGVSKHMGALATSFATDTSLVGLSKPMDALVKALGTDSGVTSPSSTPGMTALIKSLNANVSGATIAAIAGAGKPFVVEIGQATGTAGSKDPVYKPIAVLLKLHLNDSFP